MSSSSSSDEEVEGDFMRESAVSAHEILIPERSKEKYLRSYDLFNQWRTDKGIETLEEHVFLEYFEELSITASPPSLWCTYSKLKNTIMVKHEVDLKKYSKLIPFLKNKSLGYKSKKSPTFNAQQMETFIFEAPDEIYLAVKVVLIVGVSAALRLQEIRSIKVDDIEIHNQLYVLKLPIPQTNSYRKIVIRDEFTKYLQAYMDLRPEDAETDRFFLNYQKGRCRKQVIGRHTMASFASKVAEYLKLPNPKLYAGFCLRRTALVLEKNGGWDSHYNKSIKDPAEERNVNTEPPPPAKKKKMLFLSQYQHEPQHSEKSTNNFDVQKLDKELVAFENLNIKVELEPIIEQTISVKKDLVKKKPSRKIRKRKPVDKPLMQVCILCGLNPTLKLATLRKKIKQKTANAVEYAPEITEENCTSIFIGQLPLWFNTFHLKALIKLYSDFDVESGSYYPVMLKNSENDPTGEYLLIFLESSDCLQVYTDLRGVEFGEDGPIIVKLDLGDKIANERGRCDPRLGKQIRRFKANSDQVEECRPDYIELTKDESLDDSQDNDCYYEQDDTSDEDLLSIKSEILQYSGYENATEGQISMDICEEVNINDLIEANHCDENISLITQQDPLTIPSIDGNTKDVTEAEETNEEIYDLTNEENDLTYEKDNEQTDNNMQDKQTHDETSYDYNDSYNNCRIVHIKNVPDYKLLESIGVIRDKIGIEMHFEYYPVFDEKSKQATHVLLKFSTHEDAKKACFMLNGLTVLGKQLDASMGVGYQCKNITLKDLRKFQRKRKLINTYDCENQLPTKEARTSDTASQSKSGRTFAFATGFLPPEYSADDEFGLSHEYIRKLGIRLPFTRKVIVSRLRSEVTEAKLFEVFSLAGEVKKIQFFTATVDNLQLAKVEYDHPLEAIQAISMFHNHKLYNEAMNVQMDLSQTATPLPQGLESVGRGLGSNGEPLRGLRIQAELTRVYETLTDLGGVERVPNHPHVTFGEKPVPDPVAAFKFSYKKCKPMRFSNINTFNVQTSTEKTSPPDKCKDFQNIINTKGNKITKCSKDITALEPLKLIRPIYSNVNITDNYTVISQQNKTTPSNQNVNSVSTNPIIFDPQQSATQNLEPVNTDPINIATNIESNQAQVLQDTVPIPVEASIQPVMQLLAGDTSHTLVPRPGCSKEEDNGQIRYPEKDPLLRNSNEEKKHKRESSNRERSEERDPCQRREHTEDSQRGSNVESNLRTRKRSIENRKQNSSSEKDSQQRQYSTEEDDQNRNNSKEIEFSQRDEDRNCYLRSSRLKKHNSLRDSDDEHTICITEEGDPTQRDSVDECFITSDSENEDTRNKSRK